MDYHRKEAPGTIVIDTDARFLYLVQANQKALRYGVTVGEEAQGWSGVAKIGNMTEWPSWTPTAGEHQRLGPLPNFVAGGPQNPMGARAMYLFANGKDTLFRIHGTNQPEYIGQAISSGCIRLTNEDVIDLYSRVKMGSPVVVLAPGQGDSPYNPRVGAHRQCRRPRRPELRFPVRVPNGTGAKLAPGLPERSGPGGSREQPLFPCPIQGAVERPRQPLEHVVKLIRRDDQRRA